MVRNKYQGSLGFHGSWGVWLALLVKQSWRILVNGSSLSVRILKALIKISWIWIWEAHHHASGDPSLIAGLKQGLMRRIRTKEITNIWSTDWRPTAGLRRSAKCRTKKTLTLWVSLLMCAQRVEAWEKLQTFFTPADIEVISNIPLCNQCQKDFWAWHQENGFFSVDQFIEC